MIFKDLIVVIAVVITIMLGFAFNLKNDLNIKAKSIYAVPVIASIIHFLFSNRNPFMYIVYFAGVLELFLIVCRKRVLIGIVSVLTVLISIIPLALTIITDSKCYASLGYADAFSSLHKDMKARYALQDWKETDFDSKYEEYMPLFEEADKNGDKHAYISNLLSYLSSYKDGHVQMSDMYEFYGAGSTRNIQNSYKQLYNNYYGMTLIKLDTDKYVAANVIEGKSAASAGIKDGTVITKWNGSSIEEQIAKMDSIIPVNCFAFADSENIERFKPFFLSCQGDDEVKVQYLDEGGNVKEPVLSSCGNGYEYLYTTIKSFLQKSALKNEELSYVTLDDGIGYLQVNAMGADYDNIRNTIGKFIDNMKSDNISSLIIDVRNNQGGADDAGVIITEQFAKEDMPYLCESTYDPETKDYVKGRQLSVDAEGSIDIPIYLLVNSNCISAGEGFAYNMAKLDNVTVVGIQGTNGSFGTISGAVIMPEGMMAFYPSIACLDENGEVMIDSRFNKTGGIKTEIVIPVTSDSVGEIFDENTDYELEYVLNLIK